MKKYVLRCCDVTHGNEYILSNTDLGMFLDKAEARVLPLRCGIVRRVSLTQVRLVVLTQDSQFEGFWKDLLCSFTLLLFLRSDGVLLQESVPVRVSLCLYSLLCCCVIVSLLFVSIPLLPFFVSLYFQFLLFSRPFSVIRCCSPILLVFAYLLLGCSLRSRIFAILRLWSGALVGFVD